MSAVNTQPEAPHIIDDKLLSEQTIVQSSKYWWRDLLEYDGYVAGEYAPGLSIFLQETIAPSTDNFWGIIDGVSRKITDRPIHWVEMAGGLAVAMREVASDFDRTGMLGRLQLTNVDLFHRDFEDLPEVDRGRIYAAVSNTSLHESEYPPKHLLGNAETIKLPEAADIITSIEGIQYFSDPLRAIANWYNQLEDQGIMIAARKGSAWSEHITQVGLAHGEPLRTLLSQLEGSGIKFAADQRIQDVVLVYKKLLARYLDLMPLLNGALFLVEVLKM
jgi:hypothetical protein